MNEIQFKCITKHLMFDRWRACTEESTVASQDVCKAIRKKFLYSIGIARS